MAVETTDAPTQMVIDYIARRNLRAGERLPPIKELARELNLGPHAVRDALLHAQAVGVVQVRPRSGAFVRAAGGEPFVDALARALPRALSEADPHLLDVLEARRVIEAELAATAAARRRLADLVPVRDALRAMYADPADYAAYVRHNEAFHLGVAALAGNRVLQVVLRQLVALMRPVLADRRPATWADAGSPKRETDRQEHAAVYAALVAGDPSAARAAMVVHLRDTTDSLLPAPAAGG